MKKKLMFLIIVIIIIAIIVSLIAIKNKKDQKNDYNNVVKESEVKNEGNDMINNSKESLVVYFSATGTTKEVAEKIANVTSSDIEEIIPKDKYTSDDLAYQVDNSRANKEQNDSLARPEIENKIDVSKYDIIYLGYPVWWGDVPKIVLTFLDTYDLDGKTVIPFCTSGSTGISQSQNTLENYNKNIKWLKGKRFTTNVSDEELNTWIKELN